MPPKVQVVDEVEEAWTNGWIAPLQPRLPPLSREALVTVLRVGMISILKQRFQSRLVKAILYGPQDFPDMEAVVDASDNTINTVFPQRILKRPLERLIEREVEGVDFNRSYDIKAILERIDNQLPQVLLHLQGTTRADPKCRNVFKAGYQYLTTNSTFEPHCVGHGTTVCGDDPNSACHMIATGRNYGHYEDDSDALVLVSGCGSDNIRGRMNPQFRVIKNDKIQDLLIVPIHDDLTEFEVIASLHSSKNYRNQVKIDWLTDNVVSGKVALLHRNTRQASCTRGSAGKNNKYRAMGLSPWQWRSCWRKGDGSALRIAAAIDRQGQIIGNMNTLRGKSKKSLNKLCSGGGGDLNLGLTPDQWRSCCCATTHTCDDDDECRRVIINNISLEVDKSLCVKVLGRDTAALRKLCKHPWAAHPTGMHKILGLSAVQLRSCYDEDDDHTKMFNAIKSAVDLTMWVQSLEAYDVDRVKALIQDRKDAIRGDGNLTLLRRVLRGLQNADNTKEHIIDTIKRAVQMCAVIGTLSAEEQTEHIANGDFDAIKGADILDLIDDEWEACITMNERGEIDMDTTIEEIVGVLQEMLVPTN